MSNPLVILGRGVAVVVLGLTVSGCPRGAEDPAPPAQPIEIPTAPSLPPAGPTALTRADIVDAARQAASGYASGAEIDGADVLMGRTFSVVTPVGCGGPEPAALGQSADGVARVAWSEDRSTIQFSLTPGDWSDSALITGSSGDWEEVEGIWLPRPWMDAETCPVVRTDPLQATPPSPAAQTVGLAVVHPQGGSRLDRRNGRAYAYTIRGEAEAPTRWPEGGLRLRLEGRIVGFPGGRAFRCRAAGPDSTPVCVAAVQLDRVALERPTGEALSEWRGG